jgi:hypothetical protein
LNNGNGTFAAPVSYAVGNSPVFVAISNLNAGTVPDLAVANSGDNTVSVLLGAGGGAFGAATPFAVGSQPSGVAIGNLNADANRDLAVANKGDNSVSILINNGAGSFTLTTNYFVGAQPSAVLIADMNHDTKADLIVANEGDDSVWILPGGGAGAFTNYYVEPATAWTVGDQPRALVAGDFNFARDADPDLAVANYGSGNVSILLNGTRLQAYSQSITMLEDAPATNITLTGWGSPLSFSIVAEPTNGVRGGVPPDITYAPNLSASGSDRIRFRVTDGATFATNTVTITIMSVNDQPYFQIFTNNIVVGEDCGLKYVYNFVTNMVVGPLSERGQIIRYITTNNTNGLFLSQPSLRTSGVLVFQPKKDHWGTATVDAWLQDSGGTLNGGIDTSTQVTFTITITNINDAPVVYPKAVPAKATYEDRPVVFTIGLADIESPVANLSVTILSSNMTVVNPATDVSTNLVGTNMLITVTPHTNEFGKTLLTFIVSDGTNNTTRTALLTVLAYNDQPSFTLSTPVLNISATTGWYSNTTIIASLDKGAYNETNQLTVFYVVNTNRTLFGVPPYFRGNVLYLKTRGGTNVGVANMQVYVRDSGGGTNYKSLPQPLTINITP